jgi:hypothetical protein
VRQTFDHRRRLLSGVTVGYLSANQPRVLPGWLDRRIYPRRLRTIYLWFLVVGVGALVVWRWRGASPTWLVPVGALLLQIPHAIVVYQGDTLEIPRHGILVAVTVRLAILLLGLLAIGRVLEPRKPPQTGTA